MKKKLVILSAKVINEDIQEIYGKIPPILLPYSNKKLIDWIYQFNKDEFEIEVVVHDYYAQIEEHIKNKNYDIKLTILDELSAIANSILATKINNVECENLTILMGDTLVDGYKLDKYSGDTIGYQKIIDPTRWTTFVTEPYLVIHDKNEDEYRKEYDGFIGIFSFSKPSELYNLLLENDFIGAISKYYSSVEVKLVKEDGWIDLGHIEEFNKNKMVQTRYFNQIEVDSKKGILTKKSTEVEKFIGEILWYLKIPKNLEYLTPRIFDYSTSYESPFVKMEYYSYPTLHELFINGNYSVNKWEQIFELLITTNIEMRSNKLCVDQEKVTEALEDIYIKKTKERLSKLREDKRFLKLFTEPVIINNEIYPSLDEIIDSIDEVVSEKLFNVDELNVIHGDYFFANILYDPTMNFVRLIDPRGNFGVFGIYGDYRYDLAKLAHSVDGKYDFIVEDKFKLQFDGSHIKYEIENKGYHDKIGKIFFEKLDNIDEIKLIESLLFLSMVPLHKDYFDRQVAMIATGIKLYSEFIKK